MARDTLIAAAVSQSVSQSGAILFKEPAMLRDSDDLDTPIIMRMSDNPSIDFDFVAKMLSEHALCSAPHRTRDILTS